MDIDTWNALMDDAEEAQGSEGLGIRVYTTGGQFFQGSWTFAEGYLDGIIITTQEGPAYLALESVTGFLVPKGRRP